MCINFRTTQYLKSIALDLDQTLQDTYYSTKEKQNYIC